MDSYAEIAFAVDDSNYSYDSCDVHAYGADDAVVCDH